MLVMATSYNFNVEQGSEFYVRLKVKNDAGSAIDLTNYSISGTARNRYGSTGVLIDLQPSGVSGALTSGFIDILLKGASTATLPIVAAVYDVELYTAQGYQEKIINGKFNVYPEVTR